MPRRKTDKTRTLPRYDDFEVLDFIDRHIKTVKRSPSESEIAAGVRIGSRSTAHNIIQRLVKHGMLNSMIQTRGWSATLTITQSGTYALIGWRAQRKTKTTESATESAAPSATPAGGAAHVARGGAA